MAIAALNGPGPDRAVGFTVTCSVLGKLPELGPTVTQLPVLFVVTVVLNEVTLESLLDNVTLFVTGTVLFAANAKLSELGLAESGLAPPCELTLRVTCTERTAAPGALMLMKPTSVPDDGPPWPTDTVIERGVAPPKGLMNNHGLFVVAAVAFTCPFEDDISRVCGGGVTPGCVLNVICKGLALSVVVCACAVSRQHTIANRVPKQNKDVEVVFTRSSRGKKTRLHSTLAIVWPQPLDPVRGARFHQADLTWH